MTVAHEQLVLEAMTVQALATDDGERAVDRGEVFTRRWIVDMVLDLAGYTPEKDLASLVAVEPACGHGAFVVAMVERLLQSCVAHGRSPGDAPDAIRAFDVLGANLTISRRRVAAVLKDVVCAVEARWLLDRWFTKADFLLHAPDARDSDFVIGNPPYIRLENLPRERNALYRNAFSTMRGRSDIFVGFIECGLRRLRNGGTLGFIVADRWMRNQYGSGLRSMIAGGYSLDVTMQLHDVDAFEDKVSAYPAITVLSKKKQGAAVVANTTRLFDKQAAGGFVDWVRHGKRSQFRASGVEASRASTWFAGRASWPTGKADDLQLLAEIEERFPTIEASAPNTRVGIGVATGADCVYLTRDADAVESDCLLPLATAKDLASGVMKWSGTYLVNPWDEGKLIDLRDRPRLASYFSKREEIIRDRYVARHNPRAWYRTIDRVEPGLLARPKLLFPDLKAAIHPVLEEGQFYPHHNLYFVTSGSWDPEVLGGLLLSDIANLFVGAYCVRMRGGCFRFQAQYLRRIRVPAARSIPPKAAIALANAFRTRDTDAATAVARQLYGVESRLRIVSRGHTRSGGPDQRGQ